MPEGRVRLNPKGIICSDEVQPEGKQASYMGIITYREDLKQKSQILRKEMTKEERHLWYDFLRTYSPSFHRQKPIGNYIADFYCASVKLIVEIDGGQHYEDNSLRYDEKRTEYLNMQGITVLRFTNTDIWKHFYEVCTEIDREVKRILGKGY